MPLPIRAELQHTLSALEGSSSPERVSRIVDASLREAVERSASDVHFEPTNTALEIRFRLDGVLQPAATLTKELAANVIGRLKVLAELLTYRVDVPQEGRLVEAAKRYGADMRVSTFPTIHGEKAAVRLFEGAARVFDLENLGLPAALMTDLQGAMRERSGALLLTGPSGSGKTTTIYACLRHLVAQDGGRHIVTIEDPVEQVLEGISQSQARPGSEFDFARGLRSLLRQDPEVIMIGEIRDPETAGIATEAALTGHLVFSTLHAGSACGVIGRLLDMGIEAYLLTSALRGILNQRLVRRLCESCNAKGCDRCAGTGFHGRLLLAEFAVLNDRLREAILRKSDTKTLESIMHNMGVPGGGRATIWSEAAAAVERGLTTNSEIERVMGIKESE